MWWDIVKNQIASTKGKTFQLDFNQPMIEDEDNCKERLIKMIDTLHSLDLRDYIIMPYHKEKMPLENWEKYQEDSYLLEYGKISNEDFLRINTVNRIYRPFNDTPEEVACWILENMNENTINKITVRSSDEYLALTLVIHKNSLPDLKGKENMGFYVLSFIVDLSNHYDLFVEDVCEIERLKADLNRIFVNA